MHSQDIAEAGTDVPVMVLLSQLLRQQHVDIVQIVLLYYRCLSKYFVGNEFPGAVWVRAQVDMMQIEKMAVLKAAALVLCTS